MPYKRKKTGELELFKQIWEARPKVCEVSGVPIKEFNVSCFAHILPKSVYAKFRLRPDNIMLVVPSIHDIWDNKKHLAKSDTRFSWVFEKADQLRIEYNQLPIK